MPTPTVYPNFKLNQNNGNAIDLDTDTIKVMIVTNSYVPATADAFITAANAHEVTGTNYTAGGTTVAGVTLALDGTNAEFIHNDIIWLQSAAGFANGRYFIWYKDTGTPATSRLIMYMADTSDFGNVSGDLILDGSATTGVLNFI
jgi:hypothetical protein